VTLAEGGARLARLDRPTLGSVELPEERAGLMQSDPALFWSLKPGTRAVWEGARLTVNVQGTRGAEIPPKAPGDIRILSLGESTTFGTGVSDDETYSARLEQVLGAAFPGRRVTVINAGVPAYSSYQSLAYFERRGLALEPDLVLVYHEVNDYLPTSLRDSSNTEIGVLQTDRELAESRLQQSHRQLMRWSAVYRAVGYYLAGRRIRQFDRPDAANPLLTIGLPGYELPPRLRSTGASDAARAPGHNEKALGRRVSDEERRANLERLQAMCEARGIRLVLMHPSYRDSSPHECLLTRVAAERRVPLFETHDTLHPPGSDPRTIFKDAWHPRADGHAWLARDLTHFLATNGLIAPAK
jgi:lysophospholipase L1-like esterase